MPITTPRAILTGSHVWIARLGAVLSLPGSVIKPAGDATIYTTVQRTAKPTADDTAWVKLGVVSKVVVKPGNGSVIVIKEPSPGKLVPKKRLRVGAELMFSVTCKEVQPLSLQLAFHTLPLDTTSPQFNPYEASGEVEGWIKVQTYGNDDLSFSNWDNWCEVSLASDLEFDPNKETEATYEFGALSSPLNTGSL